MLTCYGQENERLAAINEALVSRRAFVDSDYTSEPLPSSGPLHLVPGNTLKCTCDEGMTLVSVCHSLHHRNIQNAPHHPRGMTHCKCGIAPLQALWMKWTG